MYLENKQRRLDISAGSAPGTLEELAYQLTCNVLDYLPAEPSFDDYSAVIGVLDLVKLEFYRRAVATQLDDQVRINSDVGYEELQQNK